jgi:hypothetical protein
MIPRNATKAGSAGSELYEKLNSKPIVTSTRGAHDPEGLETALSAISIVFVPAPKPQVKSGARACSSTG